MAPTYLPAMNHLLTSSHHTTPITGRAWLRIFAIAVLTALAVVLGDRLRHRPMQPGLPSTPAAQRTVT
jgi:hypothetical protein